MKENEWVRFGDELPRLGKIIEVLQDNGEIKRNIKSKVCYNGSGIDFKIEDAHLKAFSFNIHRLSGWRYQLEKRPDFSKLRKDDFIQIERECKKWKMFGGFVYGFESNGNLLIGTAKGSWSRSTSLEYIKKITRINIEEKIFEEM